MNYEFVFLFEEKLFGGVPTLTLCACRCLLQKKRWQGKEYEVRQFDYQMFEILMQEL